MRWPGVSNHYGFAQTCVKFVMAMWRGNRKKIIECVLDSSQERSSHRHCVGHIIDVKAGTRCRWQNKKQLAIAILWEIQSMCPFQGQLGPALQIKAGSAVYSCVYILIFVTTLFTGLGNRHM